MRTWTTAALALQELDVKMRGLKQRYSTLPQEKKELEGKLAEIEKELNAEKEILKKLELEIKDAEARAAEIGANIKKLTDQSAMIKKNSDYQTMMNDIQKKKDELSELETLILQKMEETDGVKEKIAAEENRCAARVKSVRMQIAEIVKLAQTIRAEAKTNADARKEQAAKIPDEILSVYSALLKDESSVPLVQLLDGGTCAGCNMQITPQTAGNVKKGLVALCDNCGHILYTAEE